MLKSQPCPTAPRVPRKRPYICNACFKQFETPSKLSRHYLIHTGQKPFQCHTCPKTFRQLVHLERHQQTHFLPFQCSICHRSFKNLMTFLKHQQLHNENLPSGMKPPKKTALAVHERPVSGPVHCSVCQKSFSTEDRWVLHQCTLPPAAPPSLGRRPKALKCDFCLKPFPSRSKLERHILIHTGQRPFACLLCGKTFRQKTHLKIHQITHMEEKPFECNFCHKSFKLHNKLLKHGQIHVRKSLYPKGGRRGRGGRAVAAPVPVVLDGEGFEEVDVYKPGGQEAAEVCSVYVIPFQCPVCEQCFESEQILETHTCFIAEDGKILNASRMNHSRRSRGRRGRLPMQLKLGLDRQSEMQLMTRKQIRNCHFGGQQQPTLEEPIGTDHGTSARLSMSVNKLLAHRKVGTKRRQFKRESWQRQWPKPFSMPRQGQNRKLAIDKSDMFSGENVLGEQFSGGFEDTIYVSSDEELLDGTEESQHASTGPPKSMCRQIKIMSKCDLCEKMFPSLSKLRRHYLIHTGQKPFACNVCGKTFRQSAHLKRHQVTHVEQSVTAETLDSQAEFRNLNQLFSHQPDPSEFRPSPPEGYSPRSLPDFQVCDLTASEPVAEIKVEVETDSILEENLDDVQSYVYDGSFFPDEESPPHGPWNESPAGQERSRGPRRSYQCSVCVKLFKSPSKLERHFLVHAGQKPFECSVCGKTFRQAPHLKRHLVTHAKEQL